MADKKQRNTTIRNEKRSGGDKVKIKNKGGAKAPPKSSTERGQIRTAKDNAWAQAVSKGKYKTLRSLMGAIHAGKYALAEAQPTQHGADSSICPSCGHMDGYHPIWCMAGE